MQARSIDSHQNARVSVFLRKLEYNQGIMFLTTNRVRDFNPEQDHSGAGTSR